ncbi:hypothetical protein HH214_15535 [Mucilaginibacter robiniae]|uniref:Uncharacterized protein n=1 Tax=Mucilaginibacter robiniae TaxID=2728022 RepID=A0A7L5E2C4_9SPHI|nr:hypothetical protein [Mucilaginibacter robiniae]QJD97181.1 hypothetical protein HH214_15535 [Mucilaginibacter robiniae]
MSFPVADWEIIPLEIYKPLLSEVKERFNVVAQETESITDKSIKCLLGFITYYFGVGVFLISNHYSINWLIYVTITFAATIVVYKGYRLITLRPSHTVGLLPENVLTQDFEQNTGFDDVEKERLFYYNAIKCYVLKIQEGTDDTSKRALVYDKFLRLTLLLVFVITVFLIFTIS